MITRHTRFTPHTGGQKNPSVKMSVEVSLARHDASGTLIRKCTTSMFPAGHGYDRFPGVDWTLVVTGPWLGPISRVTPPFERLPLSAVTTVTPAWTDLG